MKKNLLILCVSLIVTHSNADNLFKGEEFSAKNGWKTVATPSVISAKGSIEMTNGCIFVHCPNMETKAYELNAINLIKFEIDKKYKLSFDAKTNKAGVIEVVYGTETPPYKTYSRSWIRITPNKKHYEQTLLFKKNTRGKYEGNRPCMVRLYFGANKASDITVENISLEKLIPLTLNKSWEVFLKVKTPESLANVPGNLKDRYNKTVNPHGIVLQHHTIDFADLVKQNFEEGDTAICYNEFESKKAGLMEIGVAADWWMEVYVNGKKEYSTLKTGNKVNTFLPSDHVFYFPVKVGENIIAVRVLSGSKGWKLVCGTPKKVEAKPMWHTVRFNPSKEWQKVDLSSLEVKQGSALDLSSLIDAPAGKKGRLIVNSNGLLAFENDPRTAIKMRGFNGIPRSIWQYPRKNVFEDISKRFAKAARAQGYRCVRVNMIECAITSQAPKGELFNPKYLDHWDSIIANLKKEGIYIDLVLASYGLYYSPFSFNGEVFKRRNEHKLRMFFGEEDERSHWKKGVTALLNHVNPYTGLKWKDDPAIGLIEFYNEEENGVRKVLELSDTNPKIAAVVNQKWRSWLNHKYNNSIPDALKKEIKANDLSNAPVPDMRGEMVGLSNQFSIFIGELADENAKWFEAQVRKVGYTGLVSQYNFSKKLVFSAARWKNAQVVESNGYFCHPYNNQVDQYSSIEKSANFWRSINSTHLLGRPFIISEFNHAFWNPFQHENGLLVSAYSAFQNYSSIMIHTGPVNLVVDKKAIQSFTSGFNPVIRANEFLAGCLFQRGDVKASANNVDLKITNKFLNSFKNGSKTANSEQCKLALITGFGLTFPGLSKPKAIPVKVPMISVSLLPNEGGSVVGTEWATSVKDSNNNEFSLNKTIAMLKSKKVIPSDNISNSENGIFQSDTGEITMRSKECLLQVITDRSEAVSILKNKHETLSSLEILNSSEDALIAACSMDGGKLSQSSRIVFIYSTQVANTGMELSHNHRKMIHLGTLPVLMQTAKLKALLQNNNGANMSLYALAVDGSRKEKLPLKYNNGKLEININTAALKNGPTVFFELSVK